VIERADDDGAGSTTALCTAELCSGQVDTPQKFEEGAFGVGLLEIDLGTIDPERHGVIPSCRENLQLLHILIVVRRGGQDRRCHRLCQRRVVGLPPRVECLVNRGWRRGSFSALGPEIGTRG
jgi:hypothetical protein